jgi:hypothetical protein
MDSAKKGKGYSGSSAESRTVGEEDWQKCQMILEARKAEERSPPMQERIADLSDHLQKLNKQQSPNKIELRKMAQSLRVPQKKDGLNIDSQTLLQNIQRAFLAEVESLRETGSNFESPAASSSGGDTSVVRQKTGSNVKSPAASSSGADSPFVRGGGVSQPAASSTGGDSPVVRQILQDILELGRLPKEFKKPKTESDVAEYKLSVRMRNHDLRARAERELRTRFFKRHLKAF